MITKAIRCYIDGIDLACYLQTLETSREANLVDKTTLCTNGGKEYEVGIKDGMLGFSGVFDSDTVNADKIHNVITSHFVAESTPPILFTHSAVSIEDPVEVLENCLLSKYDSQSSLGQLMTVSGEIKPENAVENGVVLFDGSDTGGGTAGSAIDNAASSANGGYFLAQVYEKSDSAATDVDVLFQHSDDASTWVDLLDTALGKTSGSFEVTVAAGGTVKRYLRVTLTATGGKAYMIAAFVRR